MNYVVTCQRVTSYGLCICDMLQQSSDQVIVGSDSRLSIHLSVLFDKFVSMRGFIRLPIQVLDERFYTGSDTQRIHQLKLLPLHTSAIHTPKVKVLGEVVFIL